jgi:hypothetical protein
MKAGAQGSLFGVPPPTPTATAKLIGDVVAPYKPGAEFVAPHYAPPPGNEPVRFVAASGDWDPSRPARSSLSGGQIRANPKEPETAARNAGLERAASTDRAELKAAQACARMLALRKDDRTISSDDVRTAWEKAGRTWGKWAGSVFKKSGAPVVWQDAGTTRSTHAAGHRRKITLWRYTGT